MSGERDRPAGGNPVRSPQELAAVLGAMASQTAEPTPRRRRDRSAAGTSAPVAHRRPPHKPPARPAPVDITPPPADLAGATDTTAPDVVAPALVDTAPATVDPPPAASTRTRTRRVAPPGDRAGAAPPSARSATPLPEPPRSSLIAGRLVIPEAAPPSARPAKPAKPRKPSAPGTRVTSRASGRVAEYRRAKHRGEPRVRAKLTMPRRPTARPDAPPARVRTIRLALVGAIGAVVMILILATLGSGGSTPKPKPVSHVASPGAAAKSAVPTSPATPPNSVPSVAIPPPPAQPAATHTRAGKRHKRHHPQAKHP